MYNLFTQKEKKNTLQIQFSKREGKRRTWLTSCNKKSTNNVVANQTMPKGKWKRKGI